MKAGWVVKTLGDVCEIAPKKALVKKTLTDEQLVSFVPMDHLGELESHFTAKEDRQLSSVYKGYTYFCDNDVIIAKITPCFENGKMGVVSGMTNGVGFGSSEFVPIRGQGKTLPKYLFYYLLRNDFRENGARVMSGAVGHKRVPKEYIENLPIPLPPLEEQKRIVSILDEAFEGLDRARENAEANLKSARELFEQSVTKTFSKIAEQASKTQLGLCAGFRNDLNYGQSSNGQAIRIVGVGDFQNLYWVPSAGLKTVQIDGQLSQDDLLQEGDILAVRSNGNRALIGRTMLCGPLSEPTSFSGFCIRIRLTNDSLLSSYVCYFMKTKALRNILSEGGDGANISNLNQKMLSELDIPIPSTAIQSKTVSLITSLEGEKDRLQALYQTKLQDISDLRQSLLQKAFAGELT